jgi:hypothetical protein
MSNIPNLNDGDSGLIARNIINDTVDIVNTVRTGSYSGSFTGSLEGTASWAYSASQAISSSYVLSASYALSSSNATSASYVVSSSYASTASYVVSSSYAYTASYTPNALITASVNLNTITFTKGDTNQFTITVDTGSGGGGPGTPGGQNTQIQFNSGSTFSGSSNFIFDYLSNNLIFTGSIFSTGSVKFKGLETANKSHVVTFDNSTGELYYTASTAFGGGGGGTPQGNPTEIQYNNAGAFGGVNKLTFDGTNLSATGSFLGNLDGTAATASYITLIQGDGIKISGLTISASVLKVNGTGPDPITGNIATGLSATTTGVSSSLILSSSGAITASLSDGLVWIISGDIAANNGDSFIWSSGSQQWFPIAPLDQTAGDARYLQLAGGTTTGPITMGGSITMNSGFTLIGTASWAYSASQAVSSSYATSASYSLSSSYALSASYAPSFTSPNVRSGSFGITFDGSGGVISEGQKGYITVPYDGIITDWVVLADQIGACNIDIRKSTIASFPTQTSITGSAPITMSANQKASSSILTGWTTSSAANEVYGFTLNSVTSITRLTLIVNLIKS